MVDRLGVRRQFEALVSIDDVERGKPAPDLFLRAAERLRVDPAHCVVIEDAVHGVHAALAAGMTALGLAPDPERGAALRAAGARRSLASLGELTPDLLDELAASPASPSGD